MSNNRKTQPQAHAGVAPRTEQKKRMALPSRQDYIANYMRFADPEKCHRRALGRCDKCFQDINVPPLHLAQDSTDPSIVWIPCTGGHVAHRECLIDHLYKTDDGFRDHPNELNTTCPVWDCLTQIVAPQSLGYEKKGLPPPPALKIPERGQAPHSFLQPLSPIMTPPTPARPYETPRAGSRSSIDSNASKASVNSRTSSCCSGVRSVRKSLGKMFSSSHGSRGSVSSITSPNSSSSRPGSSSSAISEKASQRPSKIRATSGTVSSPPPIPLTPSKNFFPPLLLHIDYYNDPNLHRRGAYRASIRSSMLRQSTPSPSRGPLHPVQMIQQLALLNPEGKPYSHLHLRAEPVIQPLERKAIRRRINAIFNDAPLATAFADRIADATEEVLRNHGGEIVPIGWWYREMWGRVKRIVAAPAAYSGATSFAGLFEGRVRLDELEGEGSVSTGFLCVESVMGFVTWGEWKGRKVAYGSEKQVRDAYIRESRR